jgi:DNA-binding transcriptional MerR regulator
MEQAELFENEPVAGTRKAYYSIREVCAQTGLEPHVLRYWENEFPQLKPKKNRAGNRAYRDKDIETVKLIKQLLYEEKFTISGAKKRLSEERSQKEPELTVLEVNKPVMSGVDRAVIAETISGLREIHSILTA